MKLECYMQDGANFQARAVLAFVQSLFYVDVETDEMIEVSRWENGREQGYVIQLPKGSKQLNIAFFEHRNSDSIHAIKWEQRTFNSPTIDTAEFNGEVYAEGKYDTSFSVGYGEIVEMADWIIDTMKKWYSTKGENEI